jgi:DeoR/GlpR family transcriptional regulator of sugar metabolism
MSAHKRRDAILERLERDAKLSVSELAAQLRVSEMTVRRDLEAMEKSGILQRVHGGAVTAQSRSYEPPFAARSMRHVEAKQRIGCAAAAMVSEGETLILDAGTTTLEVARSLMGRRNLKILALSLRIADILVDEPGFTLLVPGGVCRPGERSFVGSMAEDALREFRFDTLFLTVGGLSLEAGVTEYNQEDAAIKRTAFASSRRRIAVADSSKLGKTAFARICALDELDVLVTDKQAPRDLVRSIREAGVEVVLA